MNNLTDQQIIEKAQKEKENAIEMKKLQNLSKEQAEQLLKQLFRDVGVEITWKFDDALRNIKTDERY